MPETRAASFEEALRDIETGSTPMDGAVMTAMLGDLQVKYARSMSDYKTLRAYALQLNAQCDTQAKRIEELESELAHAKDENDTVIDAEA